MLREMLTSGDPIWCRAHPQVKLTDALMSGVHFSQAKEAELAWVDGQIHLPKAPVEGDKEEHERDVVPLLDTLPQNQVQVSGMCMTVEELVINWIH